MQQISQLNEKLSDLDQKYYRIQCEKAWADETLLEQRGESQSYELEAIKNKKLAEKANSLQAQLANSTNRAAMLERKHEVHL